MGVLDRILGRGKIKSEDIKEFINYFPEDDEAVNVKYYTAGHAQRLFSRYISEGKSKKELETVFHKMLGVNSKVNRAIKETDDKFRNDNFNSKVKSHDITKLYSECNEYIKSNNFEVFKRNLSKMIEFNSMLNRYALAINNLIESVDNSEVKNYITKLREEYNSFEELNDNFDKDVKVIQTEIKTFEEEASHFEQVMQEGYRFNLVRKDTKIITDDLTKLSLSFLNRNEEFQFCIKVEEYINLVGILDDFVEKKSYLPFRNETLDLKIFWLNIYQDLDWDSFDLALVEKFERDQEDLNEIINDARDVEEIRDELNKLINQMEFRLTTNKVVEKILKQNLQKIVEDFENVKQSYLNQEDNVDSIINRLSEVKTNVYKLGDNYNRLLGPIHNVLEMLGIEKENEIIDICDYYIYSLSKGIERRSNIYGTSKDITEDEVNSFISIIEHKLYELTQDQRRAIHESVRLLNQNNTCSCLIQGDVSSGKTIVTIALMFILALKKKKSVYIVPRRVLRMQHLKTLKEYNKKFDLNLKIYDSSEDFDINMADIVVNGYSFSKSMFRETEFDLGVIDEIQLFGVDQRNAVQRMYPNIDMFYTTATPHPRTKLISLIGNMDIIEIREMPPERKLKNTEVFTNLNEVHIDKIIQEVEKRHMVFVVCPLVNKTGKGDYESIHIAYDKYKLLFPNLRVEKLLAQHSDQRKEEIISRAVEGEVDILVATKSIEVGVDIPRASVMIIHYPHTLKIKWGTSQLHQLRGRVGRDNQDSYCYIEAPESFDEKSPIGSVLKSQDVFELTKDDFNWRGFESIIGTKQSGKSGTKKDQEKRIKAYELVAKATPKLLEEFDIEFVKELEKYIKTDRIENLN